MNIDVLYRNHKSLKQSVNTILSSAKDIEGLIKHTEPSISQIIENISKSAENLKKVISKWKVSILFVGNYNSGKSSIINKLFDIKGKDQQETGVLPSKKFYTITKEQDIKATLEGSYKLVNSDELKYVHVIDTPGININPKLFNIEKGVFINLIQNSDIVVYVFDVFQIFSNGYTDYYTTYLSYQNPNKYFIVNKSESLLPNEEGEIKRHLIKEFNIDAQKLYVVSTFTNKGLAEFKEEIDKVISRVLQDRINTIRQSIHTISVEVEKADRLVEEKIQEQKILLNELSLKRQEFERKFNLLSNEANSYFYDEFMIAIQEKIYEFLEHPVEERQKMYYSISSKLEYQVGKIFDKIKDDYRQTLAEFLKQNKKDDLYSYVEKVVSKNQVEVSQVISSFTENLKRYGDSVPQKKDISLLTIIFLPLSLSIASALIFKVIMLSVYAFALPFVIMLLLKLYFHYRLKQHFESVKQKIIAESVNMHKKISDTLKDTFTEIYSNIDENYFKSFQRLTDIKYLIQNIKQHLSNFSIK